VPGNSRRLSLRCHPEERSDEGSAVDFKCPPAGATGNGAPGIRLYYDPRYYAANVLDPDGYSLEFVYKNWQHS